MLRHSLLLKRTNESQQKRLFVLIDMDTIEDKRLDQIFQNIDFVPWSYDNARKLLEQGEWVLVFPEDGNSLVKTLSMRNRLKRFDWTKFLPAIEAHAPIYPMATLGIDQANLLFYNSNFLARFLKIKTFPITPFFPWLPFPFNLGSLPSPWCMHLMPDLSYDHPQDRDAVQEQAKKLALMAEGEIQAQINRLLRTGRRVNK